jgi:hypothetical protein
VPIRDGGARFALIRGRIVTTRAARAVAGAVIIASVCFVRAAPSGAVGTLDYSPNGPPTIGDFTSVTLNGAPQLTSVLVSPFTVTDATGSGAGWHVVLTVNDLVSPTAVLPASSFTMAAPTIAGVNGADTTNVTGAPADGHFADGEKIVSAAVGFGEGTYLISPEPILLVVPANADAGIYTSSAVIDLESGP